MLEQLQPTSLELATLPIIVDGEPTDNFDSLDLLEGPEVIRGYEAPVTSPAALAITETVDIDLASSSPEKPSLRESFYRSRLGRLAMGGLTALGLAGGMAVLDAAPAFADSGPVYTVVNPDHDRTRSIYDRNSPSWADSTRKAPDFSYYGDRLQLICGTNGEAIGSYNNARWHYAKNLSRP
ncbi:MAG TPA: hypothetical protein VF809_01600, partial [Candidatus Saccharimonadales bacterium]